MLNTIISILLSAHQALFVYGGCPPEVFDYTFEERDYGVHMTMTVDEQRICNKVGSHAVYAFTPNVSSVDVELNGEFVVSSDQLWYVYAPVLATGE